MLDRIFDRDAMFLAVTEVLPEPIRQVADGEHDVVNTEASEVPNDLVEERLPGDGQQRLWHVTRKIAESRPAATGENDCLLQHAFSPDVAVTRSSAQGMAGACPAGSSGSRTRHVCKP